MKDIRSLANKDKLQDAVDNIGIAFRSMEVLTEISYIRVMSKSVKDIVKEMLSKEEETTSDSGDDICNTCDSDICNTCDSDMELSD